jgi:hypothetical protein
LFLGCRIDGSITAGVAVRFNSAASASRSRPNRSACFASPARFRRGRQLRKAEDFIAAGTNVG